MNVAENEIIKRLEELRRAAYNAKKPEFISVETSRRLGVLIEITLNLINSQQAIIAALKEGQETLQKNLPKVIRDEVLKEFANRLKGKALTTIKFGRLGVIDCYDIDNLLKETLSNDAPDPDVVKVKHGEWIKHKPDPEAIKKWHELGIAKGWSVNTIFWTCSCCKKWGTPAHKYCSHCGAKMDAQKEGAKE